MRFFQYDFFKELTFQGDHSQEPFTVCTQVCFPETHFVNVPWCHLLSETAPNVPAVLPTGLAGVVQLHELRVSKHETVGSLIAKYMGLNLQALVVITRVKISKRQLEEVADGDLCMHRCGFPIVVLNASKDVCHKLKNYVAKAKNTCVQLTLHVHQLSWGHCKLYNVYSNVYGY